MCTPRETGSSKGEHISCDISRLAPTDLGFQRETRHVGAQRGSLRVAPVLRELPCSVERRLIVKQSRPQCRKRDDMVARPHVCAAHFEKALQANLGKDRRNMVCPIRHGRVLARQLSELAREQIPKARAAHVVIVLAAFDEIHRHIERVIDVALESHAVLECKGQHAGTGAISMAPDFRAHRQKTVRLPIGKG